MTLKFNNRLSITPITESGGETIGLLVFPKAWEQIITPPEGFVGFNKVTVDAVTSAVDSNIKAENIKEGVTILGVEGTYTSSYYGNFTLMPNNPSVNFETGEATNFTTGARLDLPVDCFNPATNPFEINLKCTPSDVSGYNTILHCWQRIGYAGGERFGLCIRINDGYFNIAISTDGSTWGVNYTDTHLITANTTYWINCTYDGTNIVLKYSTDGENYTTIYDNAFSGFSQDLGHTSIGNFSGVPSYPWNDYFKGTIYLADCSLKINGETTWTALV